MGDCTWHDVTALGVRGAGWPDEGHPFDRLPPRAEALATDAVWRLSRMSAGLYVDFETNAVALHAKATLRDELAVEHHYRKYLDLYCRDGDTWRWAGVSRFGFMPSGETPLIEGIPAEWRQWRLYLPLVHSLDTLAIGIPADAEIRPLPSDPRSPVAIYGTSIVHGCGHLSRPGMAWPSIVSRRLDYPLINLGFSGSARSEPELATVLADLDPAAWVVDPLPNMTTELVETNAEPFLRTILDAHPETPLLMIEDRTHADAWLRPNYAAGQQAKRRAFRTIGDQLRQEGRPVHYLIGDELLGDDSEATTDASHPSDLGAWRYAAAVSPVLAEILT
jgi:lysophospholipase L1-like esterase